VKLRSVTLPAVSQLLVNWTFCISLGVNPGAFKRSGTVASSTIQLVARRTFGTVSGDRTVAHGVLSEYLAGGLGGGGETKKS
jgi:hypothetical protein